MWHKMLVSAIRFAWVLLISLTGTALEVGVDEMHADEPLVLEVRVQFGGQEVHLEIGVVESQKFLVITNLGSDAKLKISGDVGAIVEGVAKVNLFVEHEQQDKELGPLVNSSTHPRHFRLNEYRSGGSGSNLLVISDLWLRRGEDPVPALSKALSSRDETSCSAAIYLARLGPKAKGAVEQLINVLKEPDYCPDGRKYRSLKMHAAKALGAIGEPANESAIFPLVTPMDMFAWQHRRRCGRRASMAKRSLH